MPERAGITGVQISVSPCLLVIPLSFVPFVGYGILKTTIGNAEHFSGAQAPYDIIVTWSGRAGMRKTLLRFLPRSTRMPPGFPRMMRRSG